MFCLSYFELHPPHCEHYASNIIILAYNSLRMLAANVLIEKASTTSSSLPRYKNEIACKTVQKTDRLNSKKGMISFVKLINPPGRLIILLVFIGIILLSLSLAFVNNFYIISNKTPLF